MRKIITITYTTLDGVMQAPGGAKEDTENGFAYGGWQFGESWDEVSDKELNKYMTAPFELLLGRKTYDIWAPFWPTQNDDLIAKPFNSTKKYVVSHKPQELSWHNSELITGDVVAEIKKLKDSDGPDLVVWGSGNLIQTLLKNNLVDRMHIWIYPVTLGTGKKLFVEGTQAERFKVIESKINTAGVVIAAYEPLKPIEAN